MKQFNVVGNFEVAVSYNLETELEIIFDNPRLGFHDWECNTGDLTGNFTSRNFDFDVDIEAENEEDARAKVVEMLENGWEIEEGIEFVEINLLAIEITETTDNEI